MKITIVQGAFLPVPPLMGGAVEKVWFALGKEFARRGYEITHISRSHSDLRNEETIDGVRHIRVSGFNTPSSGLKLKALDLVYSIRVMRILPPADILVTNTFWLPILAQNRQTSHGKLYVHVARAPKGQMKFYYKAACLNTVSTPIAQAIFDEYPKVGKRVRVIAYPLPYGTLQQTTSPSNSTLPASPIVEPHILYVGRVHPEKGIGLLLQAFALLSQNSTVARSFYRLSIVGPYHAAQGGGGTAYQDALRKKTKELKIEPLVDWVGPVFDDKELTNIYRKASVFVYPSLAEKGETFGLAPLEAMAFGCPPIVSGLACFRDFVVDGVNGLIFDHRAPNPAETLAGALRALLHHPELQLIRAHGLRTAQRFTVAQIAEQHLNDFNAIMASRFDNMFAPSAGAHSVGEEAL